MSEPDVIPISLGFRKTVTGRRWRFLGFLFVLCLLPAGRSVRGDLVKVRYQEGITRGFMILRTLDGKRIADGDSEQVVNGDRVISHLVFHFKDGSLYDDTVTFTQKGTFQLATDHVIQSGPSFKTPLEGLVDATTGNVTVHYAEKGKPKTLTKECNLPPDVVNGMLFTIVKDVQSVTTVSYVVMTPNPIVVKFVIAPQHQETFFTDNRRQKVIRYVMRMKIGGIRGVLAPLIGKQPPDIQTWVLTGEAPGFAGSEGPLYAGGPIWRIELVSPKR